MSLTSHLKSTTSPVGQFIKQRFAHTANLTKDANLQIRNAPTLRPSASIPGYPYSTLGIAIDYRIRYSFAITPPQYLVAWKGALLLAPRQSADDTDLTAAWIEFNGVLHTLYPLKLIEDFFVGLETTLHTLQPVGRLLELKDERTLARYCYVLALFEEVYRGGLARLIQRSPLFVPKTKQNVEEMLDIPQAPWIDDLCAMSTLFCERYWELFLRPHTLNPTFAGSPDVGGADADDDIVSQAEREMGQAFQARVDQIRTLQAKGVEREAILRAVWGVKRDSTTSYKEASREYDFIVGFLQK